jgi:hypothetical protein
MPKEKRRRAPWLWRNAALVLLVSAGVTSCGSDSDRGKYSLVEGLGEASKRFERGRYPDFVDEPQASGLIDIRGDLRESLTPPFPSTMSFEVQVPEAGFLVFSPALITVQSVRRARVEFRITVQAEGETASVFSEVFRANRANQWHDRQIDLSQWAGERVLLVLETRAVPPRGNVLWADRVQTAWGEPLLIERPWKVLLARADRGLSDSVDWLEGQFDASGVGPDEQLMTFRFAVNLLVGGLLALFIRELYKRFSSTLSNRENFANMLPLFTLVTIMVIFVVQYSPALALGLLGALSIVRFRVSTATPEELVYVFLCVGLGVTLGASHVLLGVATVVVVTPFIVLRRWLTRSNPYDNLLLTLSGETSRFPAGDVPRVINIVKDMTKRMTVHRLDHGSDRMFFRARIAVENRAQITALLTKLQARVPQCEISSLDTDGA